MGLAKLDDAEYARRSRERNNRVNAAHRQRRLEAGKAQTNVWLSAELRSQLDSIATMEGVSLSLTVETLLLNGLAYRRSPETPPESTPAPVTRPALTPEERETRDRVIMALHSQRLSGHEIARRLGCSEKTVRMTLKRVQKGATT